MKFLCPNCKAKYQISDEKIAGRTLKMDCRRCSHAIVIRGDKSAQAGALDKSRASYSGPSPARSSSRNLGSDFRQNASAPPPPQRPNALDQWHVAINDVPVGPMKRDEISRKIATGAVNRESLAWREGLDDWRPLKNIPELSPLLRRTGPPPGRKPPLPPPPSRPLRSPPRAAAPKPVRAVASAGRPKAPRHDATEPVARGNVVPISGRRGGAAPAYDPLANDFADDEPTRVGSRHDFERLEQEAREQEASEQAAREQQRAEAERDEQDRAAALAAPAPAPTDPSAPNSGAPPPAGHVAHSDAFDPFASEAGAAAVAPTATLPKAEPAAAVAAPIAPLEAAPAERRRRAIPIGAWIAIAGAASFGVVLALMVGGYYLNPPAPIAQAPVAPATPAETTGAEPLLIEPTETPETPEVPEEPTEDGAGDEDPEGSGVEGSGAEPAGGRTPRRRGRSASAATATAATSGRGARSANTAESDARFDRFAASPDEGPNLDVPGSNRPLPGQERTAQRTELTGEQISAVVGRNRSGVQRCYETFARQSGQAPAVRIDVDVSIGGSGTVTRAVARGGTFGNVGQCIERTVRRWRFPRTSSASRVSIPFVFTGRD